jgi:hypothetical protein
MATPTTPSEARRFTRRAWIGLISVVAAGLGALGVGRRPPARRGRRRIIWIGHI